MTWASETSRVTVVGSVCRSGGGGGGDDGGANDGVVVDVGWMCESR